MPLLAAHKRDLSVLCQLQGRSAIWLAIENIMTRKALCLRAAQAALEKGQLLTRSFLQG